MLWQANDYAHCEISPIALVFHAVSTPSKEWQTDWKYENDIFRIKQTSWLSTILREGMQKCFVFFLHGNIVIHAH